LDPLRIKQDFPILNQVVHGNKKLVYLDNGATTQKPSPVLSAMEDCHRKFYANVHRGSHLLSLQTSDAYDAARASVQEFINAKQANEVIFTSGSTMSINLVAHSLGNLLVNPGDEILITEMEHHSNIVPWQQLAERKNARLRLLPFNDSGHLRMEILDDYLTDRTKIFAFTSTSNVLGTLNPVKDLTARAHAVGATVLVDAAQSVPHEVTDVQETDVDFLVFSGHKMLGPSGVGVLYGKQEWLEKMPPFLGGGSMINTVTTEGFTPGELPAKFEAGTPPIVPAVGLGAAIHYLKEIGLEAICDHEKKLVAVLLQRLQSMEPVKVLGPPAEQRTGIVSFVIDGVNSLDFATLIDLKGIAIRNGHHCAMPLHQRLGIKESNRASFYLYNTVEEVHYFADMMQKTVDVLRS
jgi:cysteine desulfurase/selenocysteine lyase